MKKNLFLVLFFYFFFFSFSVFALVDLEPYCHDGYYKIPNEDVCSRAPNCGGKSYNEVANLPAPNPQACMGTDADREQKGCAGYVPLCCYQMALKGNFTYCVGYWERLWCSPDLCEKARQNGASESNCGGSCQCGHAFESWCGTGKNSIPIEQRLGIQSAPTPTLFSTSIPTITPNNMPTPTSNKMPTPTVFLTATPTIIPSLIPTSYLRTNPTKPASFSLPQNIQRLPTIQYPLPSSFSFSPFKLPKLALPELKIDKEKMEKEADKFLGLFSYLFYQIKNLDERIELTVNNFLTLFFKKIIPLKFMEFNL